MASRPGIRRTRFATRGRLLAVVVASAASSAFVAEARAQSAADPWEISPYRVRLALAADVARRFDPDFEANLRRELADRCMWDLRPLCEVQVTAASDPAERRQCLAPSALSWDELAPVRNDVDKLVWLGVAALPEGDSIVCREFDVLLRRWGPALRRDVPQRSLLGDACFDALLDAFSPLAHIEPQGDHDRVLLRLKGGALPQPLAAERLVRTGDGFLPLLRRPRRGAAQADGGVAVMPWTYAIAEQPTRTGWMAAVASAQRQPFAARRRGAVEQMAVRLPRDAPPARVRFFARSNPDQGLAGYEVFRLETPGAKPVLVGVTDADGVVDIPSVGSVASTLLLRSDGQVLAKLVVAGGVADLLPAPIADDVVRLSAQAEVQALREELIDVVARRAILIARIKRLLKDGQGDEARRLLSAVNDLPTPANFSSRLDAVRRRLPASSDPRVQQTVDNLVNSTRELLTRFLDARAIATLQAEVNAASSGGS